MNATTGRPASCDEFRRALLDLIAHGLSRRRTIDVGIDHETPLFESGLVDSLSILELIAFVEEATGRKIAPRQVHMKNFGTIDRICAAFYGTDSPGSTSDVNR